MKLMFIVSFVAVLLAAILPARAAESLYEVTGVSAGDVLNIRSRPSASAPKVGSYGPRDSGIRVYRRSGNWALVGQADPSRPDGWVNSRFLKLTVASRRVRLPL
ncbi:MAG: SH3 domain-containing protein [Aestuariivirga sp.]